eukprot:9828148-Alexandrium_andersonii.AAC.1
MPVGTARWRATASCEARNPRAPRRLSARVAPGAHPGACPDGGSTGAAPRRLPIARVAQPVGWAA